MCRDTLASVGIIMVRSDLIDCSMHVHFGCKKQAIFHTVCTPVPEEPAVQFAEESEVLSLSYMETFKIWRMLRRLPN